MDNQTIRKIKIILKIQTNSKKSCDMLYKSISLETGYNPNNRAKANLTKQDNYLVLQINAKDTVSARASINSFLKWINLSEQIISITKDSEN